MADLNYTIHYHGKKFENPIIDFPFEVTVPIYVIIDVDMALDIGLYMDNLNRTEFVAIYDIQHSKVRFKSQNDAVLFALKFG